MTCALVDGPRLRHDDGYYFQCATHEGGLIRAFASWAVQSAGPVVCDIIEHRVQCELADVPRIAWAEQLIVTASGSFWKCATHADGLIPAVAPRDVMSAFSVLCDAAVRERAGSRVNPESMPHTHAYYLRDAMSAMEACAVLLGEARVDAQKIADLERKLVTSSHRATDLDRIADLEAMLAKCRDYPREEDEQKIDSLEALVSEYSARIDKLDARVAESDAEVRDLTARLAALRTTSANERQQIVNLQAMCDAYRDQLQARSLTPHRIVTDEMVRRAAHATINYVTNESVRMMLEAALAVPDDASDAPQPCPGEDARDNAIAIESQRRKHAGECSCLQPCPRTEGLGDCPVCMGRLPWRPYDTSDDAREAKVEVPAQACRSCGYIHPDDKCGGLRLKQPNDPCATCGVYRISHEWNLIPNNDEHNYVEPLLPVQESAPPPTLAQDIERAINRHSAENGSNTPDFILAGYLRACLCAFDEATNAREAHYGRRSGGGAK